MIYSINQLLAIIPLVEFGDLSWLLGAAIIIGLIVGAVVLVGWTLMMIVGSISAGIAGLASKKRTAKSIFTDIMFIMAGLLIIASIIVMIVCY